MQQIGDSEWPRPGRDTIGKWVPANHACPPGNPSNSFKPSYPRRSLPRQHFGPISPSHKCCKQKTYGLVMPFRCDTYKKHRVGVGSDFPRHGTFNADSHLPYTLPSSVSGNSFVCHSYENCRVSPTISFPCGTRRNTDPLGTICPSGYTVPPPSAFNTGQCLVSPTIRLLASPLFDRLPPSDSSQR